MLLTVWMWVILYHQVHTVTVDFHHELWPGGRAVLAGRSPYPPADPNVLATARTFVFPAPTALLVTPFALLPRAVAEVLFVLLLLAAALLTLRVLGVRDWRCYGALFLWSPVLSAVQTGNLSLLMALGAAVAWRYRDRAIVASLVTGVVISMKVFLWPLLIWFVATRRYKTALLACGWATALTTASYFALGLGVAGVKQYITLLRVLADVFQAQSYTPYALAVEAGASNDLARGLGLALAIAALLATLALARRVDGDRRSFAAAVAASLLFSPIVWLHYFVLLAVPLALYRPRYSGLWLLPGLMWLSPQQWNGATWQTALALAVAGAVLTSVAANGRRETSAESPRASRVHDLDLAPILLTKS